MTLSGTISNALYSAWALTGEASQANVVFSANKWFDGSKLKPQVCVSDSSEPISRYFGGTVKHSYGYYHVNVWVQVPRGSIGTAEVQRAEDMKYEVSRIIMVNHGSLSPFINIVPIDNGVPLHEIDGAVPRVLRYQITLKGALEK